MQCNIALLAPFTPSARPALSFVALGSEAATKTGVLRSIGNVGASSPFHVHADLSNATTSLSQGSLSINDFS